MLSAQQYYPFGMLMPGDTSPEVRRQYALNGYDHRYGFNGKEGDDEVKGDDNQVDFGARPYDPRSGRWLGVDPMDGKYAGWSPYNFVLGNPIRLIDPDGMEPDDIIVEGILWTPGTTGQGHSDFVIQTFAALNKLVLDKSAGVVSTKERTGHVILDFVGDNAIGNVEILQGSLFGNPHVTSEDGKQINFSENIGVFLQGDNTESGDPGVMSAATLLGHEFGHAWLAQGSPKFNALLEGCISNCRKFIGFR